MIVNQTPYPINFEMKTAQALTCRYGEVGRQYKFIADIDLTGLSANVQVIKPDGTFVIDEATVTVTEDEQYIVVEIPLQATVVKGVCRYDINLYKDEDLLLYTAEGPLWVDDQLITEDMIESVAEVYGLRFPQDFLTVENLVDIVHYVQAEIIKDDIIAEDTTWSSQKIDQEISSAIPEITGTAEGNSIEITDAAAAPLVKCVTEITGSQDLHGYDKPWVGGAGKNKLKYPYKNTSGTINGIVFTDNGDGTLTANGTATARAIFYLQTANYDNFAPPTGQYIFTKGFAYSDDINVSIIIEAYNGSTYVKRLAKSGGVDAVSCNIDYDGFDRLEIYLVIGEGTTVSNLLFKPMLRLSTESDSTFAPYSNICPITAYTEGEIEVSDGDGNVTTHTTTYPSAIYRGSEDCVNGTSIAEWIKKSSFNFVYAGTFGNNKRFELTMNNGGECICSHFPSDVNVVGNPSSMGHDAVFSWSGGKFFFLSTPNGTNFTTTTQANDYFTNNSVEIAYKLATPTTSSVTPTNLPIKSLSGYNHIESSTGDMEVEYITSEYQPLVDLIQSSSHVYSTAEQVVGKWIDGKTLYQQTLHYTESSEQTGKTYDISSIGADYVFLTNAEVKFGSAGGNDWYSAPYYYNASNFATVSVSNSGLVVRVLGWGYTEVYATIRYTKTS